MKFGTDRDGAPQLKITAVTTASPIAKGSHHTFEAASEKGQRSLIGDDEQTQVGRIDSIFRTIGSNGRGDGVGQTFISDALKTEGYAPNKVEATIDKLLSNRALMKAENGVSIAS